jgi:transposase
MAASKFTPENRGALLERFAAGVSIPDACRAAGISHKTVKGWLARGRQESEGEYHDFARAADEARAAAAARQPPMDEAELAEVVSRMARRGSVQAAKLRWEMLRAPDGQERPPADEFDELKARRAARGG